MKTKYARVQQIGIQIEDSIHSALICHYCNYQDSSYRQILIHGNATLDFVNEIKAEYCIHCKVVEEQNPRQICPITNQDFPWEEHMDTPDIQIFSEQHEPLLAAVVAVGEYGVLSKPNGH